MPHAVRIVDVARAAGVSTATVSRALSNPELLADDTRRAVFEAIRSTGYRVNLAARNLRTQRTRAILILVPNLGNPFFGEILAGISETLAESDYSALIADSAQQRMKGQLAESLRDANVDGIISLDGGLTEGEIAEIEAGPMPRSLVFACEWVQGTDYPSVRSDNLRGAQLAIRHLFDLGHRKIAHVTGPRGNVLTKVRREGMQDERRRLGIETRDEWIIRGDFSILSGHQAGQRILEMTERPTAVFCASDMVAFGLISALGSGGVSIPGEISVVGFDDIELAAFFSPGLTTIRQHRRALGTQAAALLLGSLDDGERPAAPHSREVQLIDVELVVRDSTAAVR